MNERMAMSQPSIALPYERGMVEAGTTASGHTIRIPYMIRKGGSDGPCLWVNAAVHGDEVNGVFAAQRFFDRLDPARMTGSVVVTPVANVLAFGERRKTALVDGIDMDQSFPGRADGFATERAAAALFARFGKMADVVINIHTLGTPFDAAPYAVYKVHPQARVSEAELLAHIACFEPTVACRMPVANASGELPGNIAGALDYQLLSLGVMAFMVELGGGGRLENDFVEHGVAGLMRLSEKMGILPPSPGTTTQTVRQVTRRAHRLAPAGGLFEPAVAPGGPVKAGSSIGHIRNLFGDVIDEIVAEVDCWVIAVRRDPVVHSGDRVAFLATQWGDVDVEA